MNSIFAVSVPLETPVRGGEIPAAQDHLDLLPGRMVAVVGNTRERSQLWPSLLLTIRRRPVGNALLLAGVAVAALGSALTGLGVDGTAASFAVAVALLYADSWRSPSWAYLRVAWIRLTRRRVGR